jgi:hypothetical protein
MEYSNVQNLRYGIRHRTKEERKKERRMEETKKECLLFYKIKTDVFK